MTARYEFENHVEARQRIDKAERALLVSYRGENAAMLRVVINAVRLLHTDLLFLNDEESRRFHERGARDTSQSKPGDDKKNRLRAQEDFFKMATERHEPEKVNAQFVKITRIGQTVAGTITRFGENDNGTFMILGGDGKSFAYAREQLGGEWMKLESFAVGLSAGLVRKIQQDRDKGIVVLCHYRDDEKTEKGGVKRIFKVVQLDASELADIEAKATDRRAERAEQEQNGGKMLPIFAEQSRGGSDPDTENLI